MLVNKYFTVPTIASFWYDCTHTNSLVRSQIRWESCNKGNNIITIQVKHYPTLRMDVTAQTRLKQAHCFNFQESQQVRSNTGVHWIQCCVITSILEIYWMEFRGPPFSLEWGVINFRKYLGNIFVTPLFDDQKCYDPPPGTTMLKKYVNPNARSAENMHFGAISLNKIFIKIWSYPIISWFFCDRPYFSWKNSVTPSFFMPPIQKKMIAPLIAWFVWQRSQFSSSQY